MFRNRLFLLLSLLAFSLIIMTVQAKNGPINPMSFISYPLNTINNILYRGTNMIKLPYLALRSSLSENERLNQEIKMLRLQLQDFRKTGEENKRLKDLLGLKSHNPHYITSASLISKGADFWFKTMIIDKGSRDGVHKNMIAITPRGLTGKIIRVWPSYSEMLLITDSSFSVSVRLRGSRVEGILTGTGGDHCILNYVSNDVDVKEGDTLITSGLDRFTPKGILAGTVKSVRKTSPELFQHIEVKPFVNTSKLEEVMIIKQ
ncbi:cell shape-determining protein MreC precursor [bacterium BMS3Bbin05]|nr:cell shape-determining protein MreC precursor [bacterium BMS3Bbin05]HDO22611.1 rod shape-determining protein MreC [Nitrospirota bacterium]HDZ88900.1 rod shape-determining protein MreC [Nitrospirota bacterium]